jgi:hypothetical protein
MEEEVVVQMNEYLEEIAGKIIAARITLTDAVSEMQSAEYSDPECSNLMLPILEKTKVICGDLNVLQTEINKLKE